MLSDRDRRTLAEIEAELTGDVDFVRSFTSAATTRRRDRTGWRTWALVVLMALLPVAVLLYLPAVLVIGVLAGAVYLVRSRRLWGT